MRTDASPALYDSVVQTIRAWADGKFREVDGATIIGRSGRPAQCDVAEDRLDDGRVRLQLATVEEADGGMGLHFETSTKVLLERSRLFLRTEVLLGRGEAVLGGQRGIARAPRFFSQVVALPGHWHFAEGADRLLGQVLRVGRKEVDLLVRVLSDDARRLPLVLVSIVDGQERFDGLSASLARATTGLAHVVAMDEAASWELTDHCGEAWSCYGRAVRVFWPRRFGVGSPYDHALHLADRMPAACTLAVDRIVQPLIEASSLLGGYPAIDRFERDLTKANLDAVLARARVDRDYDLLEETYAKANDALRAENERLNDEVGDLKAKLSAAASPPVEPLDERPESLAAALTEAWSRHGDKLTFADDWRRQLDTINPDEFGPNDLTRHLDLLGELATRLREGEGSLGTKTALWCREQGFDCTGDSETDRKAKAHQWRVEGRWETFDLHLKPNDAKSPDRCVRIYFKTIRNPWRVAVGYVGSKVGLGA